MISKQKNHKQCFVWTWLPEKTQPVVAGKCELINNKYFFSYDKHNYVNKPNFPLLNRNAY